MNLHRNYPQSKLKKKFSFQPSSTKKEAQCLENLEIEDKEVLEGVTWADLMRVDIKSENLFITSSVQFSSSVMPDSLQPHGLQLASPPCPSPTPRVYSNSCPSSQWCHPTISSTVIPFSYLQSYPASGSFPKVCYLTVECPGCNSKEKMVYLN